MQCNAGQQCDVKAHAGDSSGPAGRILPWMRLIIVFLSLVVCIASPRAADLPDSVRFLNAIEMGDLRSARTWLERGLPPDFEGSEIGSGLMIGAWEGNLSMMDLFHRHGADVNHVNRLGEQALQHAAWRGKLDAVRWLVDRGAQINRQGREWSALHYAVFAGHEDVVDFLVGRGADINALSTNGSTPLMMAAREGREAIAGKLLRAGADRDILNEQGENALHWAMRHNNLSIARAIGGTERFAVAATRRPETWGAPVRSQPTPDRADTLMTQARRMEAAGRRDEALKLYRAALAAIRRADAARKIQPAQGRATGMVITARRGSPESQSASLSYAPSAPESPTPPEGTFRAGEGAVINANDSSDAWLQRARELESAGKRKEALRAYRKAAASLRAARDASPVPTSPRLIPAAPAPIP